MYSNLKTTLHGVRAGVGHPEISGVIHFAGRHLAVKRITAAVLAIALAATLPVASAETEDSNSAMVGKYVDATHVQQEALKGVQMEMEVEASLPRLAKHGKLKALRNISRLGQITYKALGFSGDNTVKQEVIARYLAAESEARDNGSIAITPANYKFKLSGKKMQGERMVYMFALTPRKKVVGLFKGDLWVDAATGMPVREAGEFVKSPSVFLKKIAFVRDYELHDGVAVPKHIASTVDTRLVGRAELQIAFSNFSKQVDGDAVVVDDSGTPALIAAPEVSVAPTSPEPAPARNPVADDEAAALNGVAAPIGPVESSAAPAVSSH